jgi:hypothetical protein
MSDTVKFRLYLGIALVLYAWGLGALWVAHDWGLTEFEYLFVGVLPVLGGVLMMTLALINYIGLVQDQDNEESPEEGEAA